MWIRLAGEFIYMLQLHIYLTFCFIESARGTKKWKTPCGYVWQEKLCLYIFMYMFIWIMFCFMTAETMSYFQWDVDTYDGRSHLYLLQLCIRIVSSINIHDLWEQSLVSLKGHLLFVLSRYKPCISNMYILDQNSRLPYHTICVAYLDYILLVLVCEKYPLNYKTGRCWNLLGSYPSRITLIELSHKWN